MQNLFGRTYEDGIGSTDKDLILKTRGEVKIQIGKRFVDLIKNGKIVGDTSDNLFQQVESIDKMSSDGFYLCEEDVYVKIGKTIIKLQGEKISNDSSV